MIDPTEPDPKAVLARVRARLGSTDPDPKAVLARVRARLGTAKETFGAPEFSVPGLAEAVRPGVERDPTPITAERLLQWERPPEPPKVRPTVADQVLGKEQAARDAMETAKRGVPAVPGLPLTMGNVEDITNTLRAVPVGTAEGLRLLGGGLIDAGLKKVGGPEPFRMLTEKAAEVQGAPGAASTLGQVAGTMATMGAGFNMLGTLAGEAAPETFLGKVGEALQSPDYLTRVAANIGVGAPLDIVSGIVEGQDTGHPVSATLRNLAFGAGGALGIEGLRQPMVKRIADAKEAMFRDAIDAVARDRMVPEGQGTIPGRPRAPQYREEGFAPEAHPTATVNAETAADIVEQAPPPPPVNPDDPTGSLGEWDSPISQFMGARTPSENLVRPPDPFGLYEPPEGNPLAAEFNEPLQPWEVRAHDVPLEDSNLLMDPKVQSRMAEAAAVPEFPATGPVHVAESERIKPILRQNHGYANVQEMKRELGTTLPPNAERPAGRQPTLRIILGPSGAGKTGAVREAMVERPWGYLLDADQAGRATKNWGELGAVGRGSVHEHVSDIVENQLFAELLAERADIVFPKVGKTASGIVRIMQEAKARGYRVEVVNYRLPRVKAAIRAVKRMFGGGIVVNPAYIIRDVGDRPAQTFRAVRDMADWYRDLSSDVKLGEQPIILDEGGVPYAEAYGAETVARTGGAAGRGVSEGRGPYAQGLAGEGVGAGGGGQAPAAPDVVPGGAGRVPSTGRGAARVAGPRLPGVEGRADKVNLPDGSTVPVQYRVVEGSSLIPSHDPSSFQPQTRYPREVQGRRYHEDVAARESVAGGAMPGRFNPDKLTRDTGSPSGTPVVTEDGIVIMGNQRTMMLQRLAQHNPAGAEEYKALLRERAQQFGIDPAELDGLEFPVLVREAKVDPTDTKALKRLNDLSDTPATKTRSALDEGAARAARLADADEALAHFAETVNPDDTLRGYLSSPAGASFVRALQRDGVLTQAEMGRMLDGNAITADGKQLIEHMMYASAIEDTGVLSRAQTVAARELNKLDSALPAIVAVNRAGGGYGLADDLQKALSEVSDYRANGAFASLEDYRGQGSLFGDDTPTFPQRLATLLTGPKATLNEKIREYARRVAEASESKRNGDLFGYEPPTPAKLKEEIFGSGRPKASTRGAIGAFGGPGFKSRLVSAAEAIKLEKAPARTWISKLRGVASSGDEFDWALGDALKADPTRQWTKAEIVALAKERGYGSLTETVRGGKEAVPELASHPDGVKVHDPLTGSEVVFPDDEMTMARGVRNDLESTDVRKLRYWSQEWEKAAQSLQRGAPSSQAAMKEDVAASIKARFDVAAAFEARADALDLGRASGTVKPTKFATYTEPGGENYREVLLRVPTKTVKLYRVVDRNGRMLIGHLEGEAQAERALQREIREGSAGARIESYDEALHPDADNFTASHWDEPNVLAHIRMNDRVGPNGEKILHIEEIQSDWHQTGRKEGYRKRPPTAPAGETDPDVLAAQSVEDALHGTVPDAPFKETPEWLGLSLKRVLDEAVAGGYDAVSWTPGAKQADRYPNELRKAVDRFAWTDPHGETGERFIRGFKDGKEVFRGTVDADGTFRDYVAAGKSIDEVMGKDMAKRIMDSQAAGEIAGPDFTVGGEGMKAFYDQMLPDVLRGYAKKLGVKLEMGTPKIPDGKTFNQKSLMSLARRTADDGAEGTQEVATVLGRLAGDLGKDNVSEGIALRKLNSYKDVDPETRRWATLIMEAWGGEHIDGFPQIKVTPELRTALSKGQALGFGHAPVLSSVVGAGVGGTVGAAAGDTPEEKRRYAILGALAGAAIGGGVEVGLTKLLDRRAPLFPGGKPRLTPAQVDQIATTGRMPDELPPVGQTPAEDYAHIASFATDPDGTIRLKEELRRAGPLTRGDPKTVESWDVVRHIAKDLGFNDVALGDVKRLNRAEMLAIRDIVHTNIEHINANVRKLQTDPTLSQAERTRLAVLVQGMEHQNVALLDRFIVARGETGRNLNAMKMFAMSTLDPTVWLAKAQQVVGGAVPDELQTALLKALGEGDREGAIKLLMDARKSSWGEKTTTFWKANLLSNPMTHVVNISSNAVLAGAEQVKNGPAAVADWLMSLATKGQRTTSAYSSAMGRAGREGAARGMRGAWKTLTTGLSPEQGLKYDIPRQTNYDSKILQLYTESIFRTLGAEDQVFREMALSMSLANQATTKARLEGYRGKLLRARVEELRLRPSDEMAIRAIGDAEEAVVRDQTRIGRWLQATAKHLPGGQYVAPFTRTPGAVATRLAEYSPLYGLPVGSYRTGRVILQGLKGEKVPFEVQREAAKLFGRGATGTAIVALGAYLASKGLASGPTGSSSSAYQTEKVTGRTGSSVRLGDFWTDVSRVTPVGMLLSLGAGMYNIHKAAENHGTALMADAFVAAKVVIDQPFLQGISEAIKGIEGIDPSPEGAVRAAEAFTSRLGEGIIAGFVPASSLMAAVARSLDPVQRQTDGITGYVGSRLPGVSKGLAPTVDAFGKPFEREGGPLAQLVNPLRSRRDRTDDPVIRAMVENNLRVTGLRKTKDETPEQFATRAMAEGMAAYAAVLREIQSSRWRTASPEERAILFDRAFQRGRQRALQKLQRQGVVPRPPRTRIGGTR